MADSAKTVNDDFDQRQRKSSLRRLTPENLLVLENQSGGNVQLPTRVAQMTQ